MPFLNGQHTDRLSVASSYPTIDPSEEEGGPAPTTSLLSIDPPAPTCNVSETKLDCRVCQPGAAICRHVFRADHKNQFVEVDSTGLPENTCQTLYDTALRCLHEAGQASEDVEEFAKYLVHNSYAVHHGDAWVLGGKPKNPTKGKLGLDVGVSLGVGLPIVALGGTIYCCWKKQRKRRQQAESVDNGRVETGENKDAHNSHK